MRGFKNSKQPTVTQTKIMFVIKSWRNINLMNSKYSFTNTGREIEATCRKCPRFVLQRSTDRCWHPCSLHTTQLLMYWHALYCKNGKARIIIPIIQCHLSTQWIARELLCSSSTLDFLSYQSDGQLLSHYLHLPTKNVDHNCYSCVAYRQKVLFEGTRRRS